LIATQINADKRTQISTDKSAFIRVKTSEFICVSKFFGAIALHPTKDLFWVGKVEQVVITSRENLHERFKPN